MEEVKMEEIEEHDSPHHSPKRLITKNKLANIVTAEDGTVHYCCIECPVRYLDKAELELHLCVHTKEYRYLCGICGKGLKRKEHLDRHTMEHDETRPHVCPECGKGFKRKEHLNIHLSVHKVERAHSCGICGRRFSRKDHVQKHLQTHGEEFSGPDPDAVKTEEVDLKSEVVDEFGNSYGEVTGEMVYEQSQEIDPLDASTHVPILPSKGEEIRYPCYFCEKTYKIRSHLQAHLHTHVNKDQSQEVSMELCPDIPINTDEDSQWTSFNGSESDSQDIQQTMQNMGLLIPRLPPGKDDIYIRPHECEICHKRFKRRQHLKVHMNVHQRLQPTIWCSLCNEGFFANEQFEKHKCNQSGVSGEAPEALEVEPDITTSPERNENKIPPQGIKIINAMDDPAFLMMHEKESNIPVPQKVYVCKFCSKPFRRKDHYKIHQHIHTGVKSFFCTDCGKGFYRKDHLQKHSLVHQKTSKPPPPAAKKKIPDLYPIHMAPKQRKPPASQPATPAFNPSAKVQAPEQDSEVKPEITIHAPSSSKLRVPLQMKVPYQMVMSLGNGQQRAVTVAPRADH